ncbi:AAA family ATPase [Vibrio harveyi]|uniref:AAA family ATPase n=1 Tax=Vibrio harveyi TaxID=669 RepID=UPI004068E156
MRLINLTIDGLFGYFDHQINFEESKVKIITAPNGYGKTVCLKILESIFSENFNYFKRIEFSTIKLDTDQGFIELIKNKKTTQESNHHIEIKDNNGNLFELKNVSLESIEFPLSSVERFVPYLTRIEKDLWMDTKNDDTIDISEIISRYPEYLPDSSFDVDTPEWLSQFCNSIKVHFIQDQRLITKENSEYKARRGVQVHHTETILMYAKELSRMIATIGFESSAISQSLDSSFPVRLMTRKYQIDSIDNIKTSLSTIQKRREELSSYGLINSNTQLPQLNVLDEIRDEDRKVLTLYIEDTKKKLEKYNDIYDKINTFATLIKNKNLTNKEIKFSQEKGFFFTLKHDEVNTLPLTHLSSGEQHQIVLLYELIFKVPKNSLILIDEPEISLHVAWQKEFLNDLKEIISLQKMSVIMATHSPTIVGGNWDLVTDLEGESDE